MSPLGLARPADCGYDRVGARPPNFTDSDEANELIANDPMALLVGFALDQHWSVQM